MTVREVDPLVELVKSRRSQRRSHRDTPSSVDAGAKAELPRDAAERAGRVKIRIVGSS